MNFYWPVFRNLENELIVLSNQIHFDDEQLEIYSVKISELLIRCSVEIESISKEIFLANGGEVLEARDVFFDTDCLEFLENLWCLSKKKVIVSAPNFYFTNPDNQILSPLNKANKRGTSGSDWKKAYQAVKHDRNRSLRKGNLKYLMRAMGALYLLNIYYKNDGFPFGEDGIGLTFDERLGSELFSIKLHVGSNVSVDGVYTKKSDFDECVYFTKATDETAQLVRESMQRMQEKRNELTNEHLLKLINQEIQNGTVITADNIQSKMVEIYETEKEKIGSQFFIQAARGESSSLKKLRFEAILNKNQV